MDDHLLNQSMRLINFILSCTGLLFNFILILILVFIGRRQCATYFILILMTLCDFLYCAVYVSIMLTVDQYINIINYQIICPLSFFLTPFTFTGSTLLLFISLLHFITKYVRKYDSILGQLGGRLSVVFVLAFLIIRSVLGSTSIELLITDADLPNIQFCTIDMNTTTIVATVQKINHIFAEVTDILVYIGWIIIIIMYLITLIPCKKSYFYHQTDTNSAPMMKPVTFASLYNVSYNTHRSSTTPVTIELTAMLNLNTEPTVITNKERHKDVSLIILLISFISILFYLPIMINKYLTMYFVYCDKALLTDHQTFYLQIFQHTAHLFCLSIRCLPYFLFDKRIHEFLHQMIGMKCMKIERKKYLLRKKRQSKLKHKVIWHCQCYRRQHLSEFQNNEDKQNHQENRLIKN